MLGAGGLEDETARRKCQQRGCMTEEGGRDASCALTAHCNAGGVATKGKDVVGDPIERLGLRTLHDV